MPDHRVALFSKYPVPGKCKTRLIPTVGEDGAAYCQIVMTEKLLSELRGLTVELWETGGSAKLLNYWLQKKNSGITFKTQVEGGLGHKIAGAFDSAFAEGAEKLVIVGADIPAITAQHVQSAFEKLSAKTPMVIQAALDGGYVLVGMVKTSPDVTRRVFVDADIAWGTDVVLRQQLQAAADAGVPCAQINEALHDVDLEEDLPFFEAATGVPIRALKAPRVVILTPLLNESVDTVTRNIQQWAAAAAQQERLHIVFSDGGSRNFAELKAAVAAVNLGVRVDFVETAPSRGGQLQAGVDAINKGAFGEVVVMVHADTVLPDGYDDTIVSTLRTPGVSGGAFRLAFDQPSWKTRMVEWGANVRTERFGKPYGDQAIFVFLHVLNAIGGVRRDYPLLEDVELTERIRNHGHLVLAPSAVTTSSRRYYRHGFAKILVSNQIILWAYSLGVSPATLCRYYYSGAPYWWLGPLIFGLGLTLLTRQALGFLML